MLKIIALFGLAFVAVTVAVPLVGMVFFPLIPVFRNSSLEPAFSLASTSAAMFLGMLLFGLLSQQIGVEPWFLMFLVPYLAVLGNDLGRIQKARTGQTPIRAMLENSGEVYDPVRQAKREWLHAIGDTVGLWGAFVLLRTSL